MRQPRVLASAACLRERFRIARPALIGAFTAMLLIGPAFADSYSTDVGSISIVYDYGPPYSYPRDVFSWNVDGDWSPSSGYFLEEEGQYHCMYYDSGGQPVGSDDEQFFYEDYVSPPVDANESDSFTGRITAGLNKPQGSTNAVYTYTVWSSVISTSTYLAVAEDSASTPGRAITFP